MLLKGLEKVAAMLEVLELSGHGSAAFASLVVVLSVLESVEFVEFAEFDERERSG